MILSTFFLNTNLYEKQISFQSSCIFYTEHMILLCIQHTQTLEFIIYFCTLYISFSEQRLGQSYLNNTSQSSAWNTLQTSTEPESSVSLERSSRTFDQQELALLNEVRRLRQKLAIENRNKKPPTVYDST